MNPLRILTHAPLPIHPDGRHARISDGFHARGDARFRQGVGHRGCDWMYRKPAASPPNHPWSSKWYEVPLADVLLPALASGPGVVTQAKRLKTGYCVIIQHEGVGTGYHHLRQLLVKAGQEVVGGQPVGIVGGAPAPSYGLWHLHHDVAIGGKFCDPVAVVGGWKHITMDEAWEIHEARREAGRVAVLSLAEKVTEWARGLFG